MIIRRLPLFAAAILACASIASGEVTMEFESTRIKVEAKPEDATIPADFKFKVKGTEPLKIVDLEVGCKCLKASLDKMEYQPGEEGVLNTIMELGAFEGEMAKQVTVISNDKANPQQTLTVAIHIPKLIVFEPEVLSWVMGDAPDAKVIKVTVAHKDPINILKLSSTRPNFTPDIKVIKTGREYEITLKPDSTDNPALGLLTVETDCKITKYAKRQTFFNIVRQTQLKQPPPAAPAPAPVQK